MTTVYTRPQIEQVIQPRQVIAAMERAFVAYSNGEAVIPPVGQLDFEDPPGDCHIKYGYLKHGPTFTIKIATGFWKNPERGLASSNGVVLVFSSQTGELLTIFQDEGSDGRAHRCGRRRGGQVPGTAADRLHRHPRRRYPGPAAARSICAK